MEWGSGRVPSTQAFPVSQFEPGHRSGRVGIHNWENIFLNLHWQGIFLLAHTAGAKKNLCI